RIRDCYSLFPGNPHSAFGCDLDHATEYNHHTPTAGGQTEPANLGAKDRYAHNRKTHGTWTDDLHTTDDGHVIPIYITPERIVIEG
ncbi:HNH endonuclease, partial [Gordonia sp. TBRC 11910]|nr:HNH endonuclease [Gordonia asplenii]